MPIENRSLLCRLLEFIEREASKAGLDIETEITRIITKLSRRD